MQQARIFILTAGAVLLAGLAAVFAATRIGHFHRDGEAGAKVWFYDQKAQRLYAAPRDLIPPDGDDGNRVRAVVIGFQGMGGDASQVKIAYLEKYAPELKALLERARDAHAAKRPFTEKIPPANSAFTQDNTMVKHPGEAMWSALGTAEARQIMSEWRAWRGPSGQQPMISVPTLQ